MDGPPRSWVGVQSCWHLDFRLLASRTMTQEICLVFIYPEMIVLAAASGSIMTNSLACILSLSHRAFDFYLIRWVLFSWKHFQLLLPLLSDIEILGKTPNWVAVIKIDLFCLLPCSFRRSPLQGVPQPSCRHGDVGWTTPTTDMDGVWRSSWWSETEPKLEKTWIHRLTYTQCKQLVCQGS